VAQPPTEINPQEEALFREVDEDLRHEKMVAFWKRFGGLIVGAAVVVVAVVAGAQGWKAYEASEREASAARYEAATGLLAAGTTDEALERLAEVAKDGGSGYAPLAALRRAATLIEVGKTEEAVTAYKLLANDGAVDPAFRDAGRILAVMRGMDILDPAEVDALLGDLRAGTGPWRALAEELAAVSALKRGDRDGAVEMLRGLANDPQAPGNSRQRAVRLLSALGEGLDATGGDTTPDGGKG
jgi:hypothetical protein